MMDGVLVGKDVPAGRNTVSAMNSIFLACGRVFRPEPGLLNLQVAGKVVGRGEKVVD